ncbi:site-2 protease family protein [bacterium]|nr:site-2 protease family protein [bacterium]
MILTILIVFSALICLLVLHELGHFLFAKKFGVEVEEFGVGYPPRIFGKKIGKTLYSLNLLPFGAFVRIKGEEGKIGIEDSRTFSGKPIWQRALILIGGVASFWLISFLIFTLIAGLWGMPTSIPEDFQPQDLKAGAEIIEGPQVQIINVSSNSPAEIAGLKGGDIIKEFSIFNFQFPINKVKDIQELIEKYKGEEITLTIQRGKEVFDVNLIPRLSPPKGEGAIGIGLARVVKLKYPWYFAPWQGVLVTARQTMVIPLVLGNAFGKAIKGEKVEGVRFIGPIGIGEIMGQALEVSFSNFLFLVAMISIWLALFNLLPIPALDGGKLLFLGIEKIKGTPINPNLERNITGLFFTILVGLMIFVTIKDILRLF